MTQDLSPCYIGGAWRAATSATTLVALNPSTGAEILRFAAAAPAEVDAAVAAARAAFDGWAATPPAARAAALDRMIAAYAARAEDLAQALATEMGAPIDFARASQVRSGENHLRAFRRALDGFDFLVPVGPEAPGQAILNEPVGVAALITPWNWPLNQIALKVGAALAAGCTMVLKPSEITPLSARIFAEIVDAAALPAGVFNMVPGDGATTGSHLAAHPDVAVVSFTGSTRAGVAISERAAQSVRRVSLELGGKSPSVVFDDADVERAVRWTATFCFNNTGQSCNAATRLLVARSQYETAVALAAEVAEATVIGPADAAGGHIGPLASPAQFDKVTRAVARAEAEGARRVTGDAVAADLPAGGFFVRPTVFADVTPEMALFRDEVFGPVLAITPFDDEDEAVRLANDTEYGLSAYVHTADPARIARMGRALKAGMVQFNGEGRAAGTPFGGFRKSGLGREGGRWGIEEFLEVKLVTGWAPALQAEGAA